MGTWDGDIHREVFFFESGGERLYGSLYAAASPEPASGTAICNSWGYEGNQCDATTQRTALALARGGGAALIFHHPGFGDSEGEPAEATMERLAEATTDALAEARAHRPGAAWGLAGMMLGSAVASLAAARCRPSHLLLVQPALRPSRYFARLERSARRAAARVPARADNAYGYPLPHRIRAAGERDDAAVVTALERYDGRGAVLRYERPPREGQIPARFEDLVLAGSWRFGARQRPELAKAAADWLSGAAAEAEAAR